MKKKTTTTKNARKNYDCACTCVCVCVEDEERHSCETVLLLIKTFHLFVFRLGSKRFNYLELSEQISLKTGGLDVSTNIDESAFKIEDYEEVIR